MPSPVDSEPQTRREWAVLLSQRIEESGMSVRRFANEVLRREARTIQRWLACNSPIPAQVRAFLLDPKPTPWP